MFPTIGPEDQAPTDSPSNSAFTPTYSTTSGSFINEPKPSVFTIDGGTTSVPEAGGIYTIRDIDSGRAITMVNGSPTLLLDAGTRGGWQWICEESLDGWVGFRNVVSGSYLGRDGRDGFYAQASKMRAWESFVLRPREAGGYNLLVKNWSALRPVAILDDDEKSPRLIESSSHTNAARWEFVKVE